MPGAARRIDGQALGLRLAAPEEWRVRVRRKRKPQGRFFIDREQWCELGASDDWNLVRIEGPARCLVEVEIFETEPTVTYDELAHSRLADTVAGQVIQAEPECEIHGLRGFSVTRRNELQGTPAGQGAEVAAIVAPEKQTVLHDGRRQVYVVSSWPEESEGLERAVEAVVRSIRVE